jgi:enolase
LVALIKKVHAREVFDSKGLPTIEVDVLLEDGSLGRAAAPGGTSRGKNEAFDLRDGDRSYYNGLGVYNAIRNVNTEIADALRGENATDQERIDRLLIELDGTEDKSRLGGNAIVATSISNAKAAARSKGIELFEFLGGGREIPIPLIYLMFGGPAFVGLPGISDFQEYNLVPLKATNYKEGFIATSHIYRKLFDRIARKTQSGLPRYSKLAGILTAKFGSNDEAFATITKAIEDEGFAPGKDFGIYTDIAASELYEDGKYHMNADGQFLSREQMIDRLEEMCERFPIISMEDCLFQEDWDGWRILTQKLGQKVQLVGDDLFVTNRKRLEKGIQMGVANAVVIKPNQVGTLTETLATIRLAKETEYGTVISARSGELWDPYIVHLCVGQNLQQGKIVGAYATGESNLNELLRVEDYLGERAVYKGKEILSRYLRWSSNTKYGENH